MSGSILLLALVVVGFLAGVWAVVYLIGLLVAAPIAPYAASAGTAVLVGALAYRILRRIHPPSREEGGFRQSSEPSDEQAGDEADTVSNNPPATLLLDIPR
ncbi:hypothetical protein B1756_00845 [Natrarchaeobaculum aegyptiacum]|uniref:Uncharacterized protein n=2 Tax=Natrarchaeobaculum aegyptiacum TaxID=745377 RepID=A0A2Z2HY67_9EURY|nr:hypothetical protein B1756_00845 [Natrarchaeobaculum aegyptiacum]